MRVTVDWDELYPVYYIEFPAVPGDEDVYDLPDDLAQRYQRALDTFLDLRKQVEKIVHP